MSRFWYLGMVLATAAMLLLVQPALAEGCEEECRQGVSGCAFLSCDYEEECLLCEYICDGGMECTFNSCKETNCVDPE